MIRKISLILSAALLMASLTACGGDGDAASSALSSAVSSAVSSAASSTVSSEEAFVMPAVNEYKTATFEVGNYINYFKTYGRVQTLGTAISCDSTASGIEFIADCEGDVVLDLCYTLNASSVDNKLRYFTVIVDGVTLERQQVEGDWSEKSIKLTLAAGLARGKHTIAIYRQNENYFGLAQFNSITLNGVLCDRPKDNDLLIEFFGDSITTGYGNLGNATTLIGHHPSVQDGMQTYAVMTARDLGADWSIYATSGARMLDVSGGIIAKHAYMRTNWYRGTDLYEFTRHPDVVVVNMHTNDYNHAGDLYDNDPANYVKASVEFLTRVRELNPDAKIVWIYGMMTNGFSNEILQSIEQMGGAEKDFYALKLPRGMSGGSAHPNVAENRAAADELVRYLKTILEID